MQQTIAQCNNAVIDVSRVTGKDNSDLKCSG